MAPLMRTCTGGHTGRDTTGAKVPMALVKELGKERMALLAVAENQGVHGQSILTHIAINGQSRAESELHTPFFPGVAEEQQGVHVECRMRSSST